MSHTPLMPSLRAALALARLSRATSCPPDDLADRWAEWRRSSRRRFLKGGVASAGALALGCRTTPPPPPPHATARDEPVIIVGAGLAGLVAGYRLAQAGVNARLYDAQGRIGGRMLSLRGRFPDGMVIELGGELIDTNHATVRDLAAELDITLDDLAAVDQGTEESWHAGGSRRSRADVLAAFLPLAAAVDAAVDTIGGDKDVTAATPLGAEALDRQSIAEWLDRLELEPWFRALIGTAYTTEYGREIGEQSALNLLLWIGTDTDEFRVFGDSDERFHTHAGNDAIPAALARRLRDRLYLNHRLEAARRGSDGRVVCTFRHAGTTTEVTGSRVLLALPFTMLREVSLDVELAPAVRSAIGTLGYGTNAKLMIGFTERLWRTRGRLNGASMSDLPYQTSWETSRGQDGTSGILTNFTGGAHGLAIGTGTAGDQAASATRDLDQVFPGIAATRGDRPAVRYHWPTHPFVKGSYACPLPGQWTTIHGAALEPQGPVFFAGEHVSTAAQGFMEGACETGEGAAAAILASLGIGASARLRQQIDARVHLATLRRRARRVDARMLLGG